MTDRTRLIGPATDVAPALLGAVVTHAGVSVRLTEVEAYAGESDPGSHAFRGRTPRNAVMFGPAGHLYVYLSYGVHVCANVVCGPDGQAQAVLLRAGEVVAGRDLARERRTSSRTQRIPTDRDLGRGPGRLGQALGLTLADYGTDLCSRDAAVQLHLPEKPAGPVRTGPRVGVRGPGGDGTAYPWRFWIAGERAVSDYRPAGRLRRRAESGGPGPTRA